MKQIRDEVRKLVFERDKHKCVIPFCQNTPDDAHHLIDRKLWGDDENGGYSLDNLVSICHDHHKLAENNTILPRQLREWAGITSVILPKTFDVSKDYDKWGNELKPPSREIIKYPHTPYLPFSPNADEKDVADSGYMDIRNLLNKPLYITIKMDGSNVVLTRNYVAARNGYDATHSSFDMLKQLHAQFKHQIPENLMIFGEWLYAKHSIHYTDKLKLHSYLQVFGIYNKQTCMWMSIHDMNRFCVPFVKQYSALYNVGNCGVVYNNFRNCWIINKVFTTEKELRSELIKIGNYAINRGHEGIVVRNFYSFHHSRWNENIAKYVRAHHVQTDEHWSHGKIVKNEVK